MVLKKLMKCGEEDISDLKMYWDPEKKQIRHKFTCDNCGTPTICVCYDKLYEAREGIDVGMLCNKCALIEHIKDGDLELESVLQYIDAEQEKELLNKAVELLSDCQCGRLLSVIEREMDFDSYGSACNV